MSFKPKIEWQDLLATAPYFLATIYDADFGENSVSDLNPLLKAAYYYDIFDAEVSNGGVAQYFYNQALYLENFEHAPAFMAAHPALAPILHIVNEVHAAWDSCADDVVKARDEDEWPEQLFIKYAPRFDALETEFYAIKRKISHALCHAILQNPHDYFDIKPITGVLDKGVQYVNIHNDTKRFRFKNGFPVGPNLFEQGDGTVKTTRFSDARDTVECADDTWQHWIHYPSGRSVQISLEDGNLSSFHTELNGVDDGVYDWYDENGAIKSTCINFQKETLVNSYFYPNGTLELAIIKEKNTEIKKRFWPNGALNTHYIEDQNGGIRVIACFDENGQDLAPNGTGKFFEILVIKDDSRVWLEAELQKGKLIGEPKRLKQNLKTGEIKLD